MYYPATATASQGEPSISIGDLQFLSYPTETISPNPLEPEPEPEHEPEPANNTESETETQQLNIVSEPITLELPPCDHDNMAEPFVPEHQLSPLNGSTSHHESSSVTESTVSHEPPFRILLNRTTRGVPKTWKLWREGTPLELKDPTLGNSYSRNEVLRCINIGLLCVQEDADARSSMSSVVVMLNSFSVTLPLPRRPPFLAGSRTESQIPQGLLSDQSTTNSIPLSVNEASITELYSR
ncbi:hypothetical protein F0562_014131 [Nyssa sinensis]|uniref:S-locus receptor kinase C-terminal domain-containing protein n=1 Tax=Nyssa sinensis TaxID=561372 RepID=A0A5J4ZPQ5_9ASTE|nr:hypothetical protein F0562_014131 [Nyssa sinensis]